MKCIFCDSLMLDGLREVWCPNTKCKTHYSFERDIDNSVYLAKYNFQNYSNVFKPNLICHAIFYPKSPVFDRDRFTICLWEPENQVGLFGQWNTIVDLPYLPDYITPFNFTEKLKTYLVFS